MPLAFDDIIARLEELRQQCERERFSAVAHQLEATIGYMTMKPLIFSRQDLAVFEGEVPSRES